MRPMRLSLEEIFLQLTSEAQGGDAAAAGRSAEPPAADTTPAADATPAASEETHE